uniref:Uncharacterized protein n=1 Tax=Anguilla anguilla TaxID=7936 RepID=A0A0E9Q0G1_ANGAN
MKAKRQLKNRLHNQVVWKGQWYVRD